jgi:hypothetical protein
MCEELDSNIQYIFDDNKEVNFDNVKLTFFCWNGDCFSLWVLKVKYRLKNFLLLTTKKILISFYKGFLGVQVHLI